jgi:hypothetical protein
MNVGTIMIEGCQFSCEGIHAFASLLSAGESRPQVSQVWS